jgi:hypothetical protein
MAAIATAILVFVCRAEAAEDIVGYFKQYYQQQVAGASYQGPLDFLRQAAAQRVSAEQVLKTSKTRAVIEDRRNGYLQISDGSDTDETLTMAIYRKADGSPLIVVGSSDCADGCSFAVEFFGVSGDHLTPIQPSALVPAIGPTEFIKPGRQTPKHFVSITPELNYLPARIGTSLTVSPWYGYEAEEQTDQKERSAVRDVVLSWEKSQGRFVETKP